MKSELNIEFYYNIISGFILIISSPLIFYENTSTLFKYLISFFLFIKGIELVILSIDGIFMVR